MTEEELQDFGKRYAAREFFRFEELAREAVVQGFIYGDDPNETIAIILKALVDKAKELSK